MKIKRNINNNVSLCIDSKNNDVVVFGKGVGFYRPGDEVPLRIIEKTFYGLDKQYISMLNSISEESLKIADEIVNFAVDKKICEFNGSLLFGLADHIDFALERLHKNIDINLAIYNDINHLYENEMSVGRFALRRIKEKLNVQLPEVEAAYIALNIINSEHNSLNTRSKINEQIIEDVVVIIESHFNIYVDRKSFNYSRFVSHMHYLFKREELNNNGTNNGNEILYETIIKNYPEVFKCLNKIVAYFETKRKIYLNNDECLYLMLHINRLCEKENFN